jgi:hypothetical protein
MKAWRRTRWNVLIGGRWSRRPDELAPDSSSGPRLARRFVLGQQLIQPAPRLSQQSGRIGHLLL